jgi:hypothetical protein
VDRQFRCSAFVHFGATGAGGVFWSGVFEFVEMSSMRTLGLLLTILSAWFSGGCATDHAPSVVPQPVVFTHSDELRRGDGFVVLADRRLFATMAFLNATGYDDEAKGKAMHPVRQQVRKQVSENLARYPGQLQRWRDYAKSRGLADFHYQDFAFSLEPDFPFRRVHPDPELGYPVEADRLRNFPEVLKTFWLSAGLSNIWSGVKSEYVAELNKYDLPTMQRQMAFLWEYLRMPRQDTLTIVIVPNLLDHHYGAQGARYGRFYYCVENPEASAYGLDFHEYLHSVVNPLVEAHYPKSKDKLIRYYNTGKGGPGSEAYQDPVTFTFECLVRALDRRIRAKWSGDAATVALVEGQVREDTANGLTLTRPFYEMFQEYETTGMSFEMFVPVMFSRLPDSPQ